MEANLRARLATAAAGIPLLVVLVGWAGREVFAGFLLLVALRALWEYFGVVFPESRKHRLLGTLFGGLLSASVIWGPGRAGAPAGWLMLLFAVYLFLGGPLKERLAGLAWTLLGTLYIGLLVPQWIFLFERDQGRRWVFFVLFVIMSGDTLAYFIGGRFGRVKLVPELSPGKTVEGALAYVAGGVAAGALGAPFLAPQIGWLEAVGLAGLLGLVGQLGDLFESWIKRAFAIKDAGTFLPGHGGVLDRIDSLVFAAAFTVLYLDAFHR
ncbi:MAG TPA: phosphatidate cytidylyltransferase [candidate division Zixibacteria bacterium]|nr:phosphatidate cytidylyltransferase [candidate division Zixibacteria bacterium]